ncbi:MAG: dihydrodipicolinate synthase family protein [Chloroflexi bacterium]|nr:dihydrodipicolinate synthase family protein [Chloroflexota bacterium]
MATVVVPWTEAFVLDDGLFRHEVATLLAAGYTHLYIFGTAGEGYAVDDAQFEHIARVFAEEMQLGHAEPMVGVISLSLETMLRRIQLARETLGVRLFQISLPSWGALADAEVRTFFDIVLGRFQDCQFLHYNLPRTKRLLTAREYASIAADHPNLVATKNSTDSMLRVCELLDSAPMLRHFLNEHGFLFGSLIGECGLLISLAATNLAMGRRYFEAGRARDVHTLVNMEGELSQIGQKFATIVGGAVVRIDGAFDKVLWRLHDPRFPLRLFPPYEGADPSAADEFLAFLQDEHPRWAPQAGSA